MCISFQRVDWAKTIYEWAVNLQSQIFTKNAIYSPYTCSYFNDHVGIAPSDMSVNKYMEGIEGG